MLHRYKEGYDKGLLMVRKNRSERPKNNSFRTILVLLQLLLSSHTSSIDPVTKDRSDVEPTERSSSIMAS
jgi:hypothetical protein